MESTSGHRLPDFTVLDPTYLLTVINVFPLCSTAAAPRAAALSRGLGVERVVIRRR